MHFLLAIGDAVLFPFHMPWLCGAGPLQRAYPPPIPPYLLGILFFKIAAPREVLSAPHPWLSSFPLTLPLGLVHKGLGVSVSCSLPAT